VQEVFALTLEPRVRFDSDGDVEVAGNATAGRGRTASGKPEALAVVDAGGHLDVDRSRRANATVAPAVTWRGATDAAERWSE